MPHHPNATIRGTDPSATPARVRIPHFKFPIHQNPPRLRASAGNPFPNPPKRRSAAFTLIELLVVVAVIAILAGITLSAVTGVQERAARDRARTEIAAISNALEQFRNIHDRYPPTGSTNLYTNIAPFFDTARAQTNEAGLLVDPYGNPYEYSTNRTPMRNPATYDLWSRGKNAAITNDDIGNW